MDDKAFKLLWGTDLKDGFQDNESTLLLSGSTYVEWIKGDSKVILDASFTTEQLKSIIWFIENH